MHFLCLISQFWLKSCGWEGKDFYWYVLMMSFCWWQRNRKGSSAWKEEDGSLSVLQMSCIVWWMQASWLTQALVFNAIYRIFAFEISKYDAEVVVCIFRTLWEPADSVCVLFRLMLSCVSALEDKRFNVKKKSSCPQKRNVMHCVQILFIREELSRRTNSKEELQMVGSKRWRHTSAHLSVR